MAKRKVAKPVDMVDAVSMKADISEQTFEVKKAVEFLMGIPEISEAFTQADIELALDDRGWLVGGKKMAGELDPISRTVQINKSRYYWLRDPLAHQAVRLWTTYGFGDSSVSYQCDDMGVQKKLKKFMNDRRNRNILSAAGQWRLSNKLLIDGEIFFCVYDDGTIRTFDPLQITEIVCDPDDEETVLCYKRVCSSDKTLYYADWAIGDNPLLAKAKDPANGKICKIEQKCVMYHHKFDALEKRGTGLFGACVNWSREHRRFMEARVALTQALAKFAWKGQVKGGQSVLNAIKQNLQSTFSVTGLSGGTEKNPQPAPGATWMQNQGLDLTAMPRATGASDAKVDGDGLKLMVSAGTGIMLHYFGDPGTTNLASATAMELPMLKQFQMYQKLWKDCFRDIFSIVLDEQPDDEQEDIYVDLPPILQDDLQKLGSFISAAATVFPEIKVTPVLKMMLTSLGVEDINSVMEKIADQKEANDAKSELDAQAAHQQALQLAQASPAPIPVKGIPASKPVKPAESASVEEKMLFALESIASKL